MQTLNKTRSIIVACDCPPDNFETLISATAGIPGIGGYKLGIALGLRGLESAARTVREHAKKADWSPEIIYDHQKGACDIPDMGKVYAEELKRAGIDTAILFPLTGPETQKKWIEACFEAQLKVLVGLAMTHPKFFVSEGGYISDEAPEIAFRLACEMGVKNFVVPGNKIYWITKLRAILVKMHGEENFVLYAPGFIEQGGNISVCGAAAGKYWHAIVGSAIYKQSTPQEMERVAADLCQKILAS